MGIAVDEWNAICAYCAPAFEPSREAIPEDLSAGDVLDDGAILMPDGSHMTCGRLWMPEHQAHNAAFYGWFPVAHMVTPHNLLTGNAVWLMGRPG